MRVMRQTYLCPNCRAPAAFGTKFCCNCGVHFHWIVPQVPNRLSAVTPGLQSRSPQRPKTLKLPLQDEKPEKHCGPGWDKPQSYNHKPQMGKPDQYRPDVPGSSVALKENGPAANGSAEPVRTEIIKLLTDLFDKHGNCN